LRVLFLERRYDEIIERMSHVDLEEADAESQGYLAFALQAKGRDSESVPVFELIGLPQTAVDPDLRRWTLVHDLAAMIGALQGIDRRPDANRLATWLDQFGRTRPELDKGWPGPWWTGCAQAVLGNRREALAQLERAVAATTLLSLPYLRDTA